MSVSAVGEFGLIDLLAGMVESSRNNDVPSWRNLVIGIGDDAAAWRSDLPVQLGTVDSLVEGVHFLPELTPFRELGWKALAVNLSDIAAMGGSPRYALIALSLPESTSLEAVQGFYRGLLEAASKYGVAVAGGNISRAPLLVVSITLIGSADSPEHLLRRSGARAGDAIAVTGCLGTAAAGLEMLRSKLSFDAEITSRLRDAFLRPLPRLAEGRLLAMEGIKTAIDISDGLLADLRHVCEASGVGARLDIDMVPVDPAVRSEFGSRAIDFALSGGEDYELVFCGEAAAIERVARKATCPVTIIGEIIPAPPRGERISLFNQRGGRVKASGKGWEHFGAR